MTGPARVTGLPPLPPRRPESHKGTYGRVLVVAGSRGMAGAAALTARAALRTGSGLVTLGVPDGIADSLPAAVPEATLRILDERPDADPPGGLDGESLDAFDALAVGPGIGVTRWRRRLLEHLAARARCPQLLDADALNLAARGAGLGPPREDRVWTPHPGEFRRLTGELPRGHAERLEAAGRFVETRRGVLLLKGHRTVVRDRARVFTNLTGNAGLATGGAGDVLTGIIASLLGQGLPPFEAACLGAHLHGLAGDLAARELGEASVVAGDVIEALPQALRRHDAALGSSGRAGPR